jgi:hypothetical protein
MINSSRLLADLQSKSTSRATMVKRLEDDLRKRCNAEPEVDAPLKEQYQAAKAKNRTAMTYKAWRDEELTQIAVAWVLGCVFVRFLEDNGLVETPKLSGPGERLQRARDEHELFIQRQPLGTEREFLLEVFEETGRQPGMKDFFSKQHNPLWLAAPSGDACRELWLFWQKTDPETGNLIHDFTDPEWNTRFLGDLYQDLSEAARDKFALLQTPEFVEEFILDRTLTPAIATFGYREVRMIDPTCGSGHFLLGGFARIFRILLQENPGENPRVLAQRALDAVCGVDLNPFAVAIARFRLLLAALQVCGVKRLKDAPDFQISLAVGDSLIHGARFSGTSDGASERFFNTGEDPFRDEIAHVFDTEDSAELHSILGRQYHAVVGNPPYITVKDKALNQLYRDRYDSCSGKYALSVPFMERFFDLALSGSGDGREPAGFTGQITSNSFMKREFAKKLIERFIPRWDLTHVIDTSGAYIPGHGTPTVTIFGRNARPQRGQVRTVMGISGEPEEPADPAAGKVWQAILCQIDHPGSESEFIQVVDKNREDFNQHPWSVSGGGATLVADAIKANSKASLNSIVGVSGVMVIPGDDDVLIGGSFAEWKRRRVGSNHLRKFLEGELVRDFQVFEEYCCHFPYSSNGIFTPDSTADRHMWKFRALLRKGICFGKTREQRGMDWREWAMVVKDKFPLGKSLVFPGIATQNHFILEPGEALTKQSLPLFRLKKKFLEQDYYKVFGYVSSSVFCFLMKQACYPKERATGDISKVRCRPETNRYDFNSTAVMRLPIPDFKMDGWDYVAQLSKGLEEFGKIATSESPEAIANSLFSGDGRADESVIAIERAEKAAREVRQRAILLQEELDWAVYRLVGLEDRIELLDLPESESDLGITPDQRPFRHHDIESSSEIDPSLRDVFASRLQLLNESKIIRFLESDLFKRQWLGRRGVYGRSSLTFSQRVKLGLHRWLLARIEGYFFEGSCVCDLGDTFDPAAHGFTAATRPHLVTANQLADVVQSDKKFLEAAEVYVGASGFSVPKLIRTLVESESVPYLPVHRYKDSGLRKRHDWEETWELQRKEDAVEARVRNAHAGEPEEKLKERVRKAQQTEVGDIAVPPKYASADFAKSSYWTLRGKLDVPKERWISYPGAERAGDESLLIAWAGWDHLQQAKALSEYFIDAQQNQGFQTDRLKPLLAGLADLIPWLKQWHNAPDPNLGMGLGDYFAGFLEENCRLLEITVKDADRARFEG